MTVIQVMLNPFQKDLGDKNEERSLLFQLEISLASDYCFIATAVSFWDNLGTSVMGGMANAMPEIAQQIKGINLGWIWSVYNLY